MEAFNRWLAAVGDNPIVQVLAFVVVFIIRLEMDRRARARAARARDHKRHHAAG